MTGITSMVFNLILGFTGAYWNLAHVAEEGLIVHEDAARSELAVPIDPSISLDALERTAAGKMPGFKAIWVYAPDGAEPEISFWGHVPDAWWLSSPTGSSALFDPRSGDLISNSDIRLAGPWEKPRMPLFRSISGTSADCRSRFSGRSWPWHRAPSR